MSRPPRQWMFMEMAQVAAKRSTCSRKQVGCIITDNEGLQVLGIGYNGNARGLENACDRDTPGECGCIHAELNALLKAPYHQGTLVLYTTCSPCVNCAKLILNSAVETVYFLEEYRDSAGLHLLQRMGLVVRYISNAP